MFEVAVPFALVVRPGCEADFDKLVARTVAGIRAHEPGTLVYTVHAVEGSPRERIFYELYRDKAAFSDHVEQPHTLRFRAECEALLESRQADYLALADAKLPGPPSSLRFSSGATDTPLPDE